MTQAKLCIDLDERFDSDSDSEHSFLKLAGDYGIINLEGKIIDNWYYYNNQKVISLDEIKPYAKIQLNQKDNDGVFDYWWLFITKKQDDKIHEIQKDETRVYYRSEPITIDGIDLIDGHFCFYIYK